MPERTEGAQTACYNPPVLQPAAKLLTAEQNNELNQREYGEKQVILRSFPYYIQIGADNRCNLKCGFCMAAADREKGILHIQDRKLDKNAIEIFDRLEPYMRYWRFLSVTGPGESLLNPKLDEILKMVRESSPDCTIVITTNGVLIDEAMAHTLVDCQVTEVSVSMDSVSKETYEELRVNAKFEDLLAALETLNRVKAQRKSRFPELSLTPNFMTVNIRELPDFIEFAARYGVSNVQATPTQIYRRSWVERSLLNHPALTRRMAEETERRAARSGIRFTNGLRMVYANRGLGLKKLIRAEETIDFPTDPSDCLKAWNSLYIEPDGEVRPCCYQSPIYGNIFEEDFEEIWNGTEARELRRQMIDDDLPASCRECYEFNRHDPSIMIQV